MAPTPAQKAASKVKAITKPPKARVARYLKSTEAKLHEKDAKSVLLLKGLSCNVLMNEVLKDLNKISSPHSKLLAKKNPIFAFESAGAQSLEFLCTKNDCALFALASHNKKRPNNLILGRMFDHHVLDLAEYSVLKFKSLNDYAGVPKKRIGSKPLMCFLGDLWHLNPGLEKTQNLLVDLFKGDPVPKLSLAGIDHVVCCFVGSDEVIRIRTYFVKLKKGSGEAPVPHMIPCGPDFDLQLKRNSFAPPDLYKAAREQPRTALAPKKVKNQTTNVFGETIGKLHLEKQDLDNVQGKRMKVLKIAERIAKEEEVKAVEEELEREREEEDGEFERDYGFQRDEMME